MSGPRKPAVVLGAAAPFLFLLLVIYLVILSNPASGTSRRTSVSPVAGRLDLSGSRSAIHEVRGEWLIEWKSFLTGFEEFSSQNLLVLPGSWLSFEGTERYGYASFALRVTGLDPAQLYAFRIGHSLTAVRVLVNGQEQLRFGTPGRSLEEEEPWWASGLARFSPGPDGTADIILHISNFRDRGGGTNATLFIGAERELSAMEDIQKLSEGILFSILAVLALFFITLFVFRPGDRHFLWFAGLCLVVAVRTMCYDGFSFITLVPGISWLAFFKLGYLTFPLAVICFLGFLRSLYPHLVHRIPFAVSTIGLGLYVPIILFASLECITNLLVPFQLFAIPVVLWGFGTIVRALVRREQGSLWFVFGFSFAIVSFVYDILVSMWIISGFSISQLGVCLCLFSLAMMVSQRYAVSIESSLQLTRQLQFINKSLQRFVPQQFLSCLGKKTICDVNPGDNVTMEMAVLAADIRSFTSIAEKMSPAEVFSFINEYLELVGPIIRHHGGFIAKYLGDGFLALFPSGAEEAVRCGIQMQAAVTGRNRRHPEKIKIKIGVGIDSGRMYVGTIGDSSRLDGTVLSSCVKSAEQLEQATKLYHARILINESVFSQLGDPSAYFIRPVDRVKLGEKGAFLFEVYNNDPDMIRDKKWKSQADLEHGLFAFFTRQHDEAALFLSKVLTIYPDDPVARLYYDRLRE